MNGEIDVILLNCGLVIMREEPLKKEKAIKIGSPFEKAGVGEVQTIDICLPMKSQALFTAHLTQ